MWKEIWVVVCCHSKITTTGHQGQEGSFCLWYKIFFFPVQTTKYGNADAKRQWIKTRLTISLDHRVNEHLWVTATLHFHNLWDKFLPRDSVTVPRFALSGLF